MAEFEQEHIGSVAMGDIGAIEEAKSIAADINSLLPGEMRQMTFWHNAALKMAAALSRPVQEPVAVVRHKKRGSTYEVIGVGKMQAETWEDMTYQHQVTSVDMRKVAVYRSTDDGLIWVRPIEEFEDGRFEPVTAAPQPAHGTSATERVASDHALGVNEKAIKAICAAVVLGEDEQGNPVHLSAEEARKAIGAYQSVHSPSSAPSLLEWQDVEALQRIAGEIQALKLHPATGEEYDAGYIAARNDAFAIVQEVIDNAQ